MDPQDQLAWGNRLEDILYGVHTAIASRAIGLVRRVGIEPEAVVVARERFPSSARNVLRGRIESVHGPDGMRALLRVRVGRGLRLDVAVTPGSLAELGLTPGTSVFLYLKATAVLRLP